MTYFLLEIEVGCGSELIRLGSQKKLITDVERVLSLIRFDSREKVQELVEKGGKNDLFSFLVICQNSHLTYQIMKKSLNWRLNFW